MRGWLQTRTPQSPESLWIPTAAKCHWHVRGASLKKQGQVSRDHCSQGLLFHPLKYQSLCPPAEAADGILLRLENTSLLEGVCAKGTIAVTSSKARMVGRCERLISQFSPLQKALSLPSLSHSRVGTWHLPRKHKRLMISNTCRCWSVPMSS